MNILALSGSLRSQSINSALLRSASSVAPAGIQVRLCTLLGALPLYNPDLEPAPPTTVVEFRSQVAAADALLIASPEYAHGVTGTIKNALDWLVSFEPFVGKPTAVLNASARASHANAALQETLRTMSATLIADACVTIPLPGAHTDEASICAQPLIVQAIRDALQALRRGTLEQANHDDPARVLAA